MSRLEGLDLARFLAFTGMVIVNFKVVMGVDFNDEGSFLSELLTGRAAATFVVLAGVGLGLAAARNPTATRIVTLRRALFLMTAGLLNMLIFPGDILHYYAVYFVIGAMMLSLTRGALILSIFAINLIFLAMLFTLNYEAGWNWETLDYHGFWTPEGFIRNLFFNGWHPVFPWMSFLIFGLFLSKLDLSRRVNQLRLLAFGTIGYLATTALSQSLILSTPDPDLSALFGTSPIPPMPFYICAGICAASFVIGSCLALEGTLKRIGVLQIFTPAGRQTLTLYMAHILIGMAVLDAFGLMGEQSEAAAVVAALLFSAASVMYTHLWNRKFKRGPLETLMRRTAG